VPVEPRPFPEELMDEQAKKNLQKSAWPMAALVFFVAAIGTGWHWRRRQQLREQVPHPERLRA